MRRWRLGFGGGDCRWKEGAGVAGVFKEGMQGISACAPKKETSEVHGRGSRLGVARAGKKGLISGPMLSAR